MPDIEVVMNRRGMQELMHSDEMRACLQEFGEQVRSRCTAGSGPGNARPGGHGIRKNSRGTEGGKPES